MRITTRTTGSPAPEPERGIGYTKCLDMRFERTALCAYEYGFPMMTSLLGISRWKNMTQIDGSGAKAVAPHDGLTYWDLPILSNADPCASAPSLACSVAHHRSSVRNCFIGAIRPVRSRAPQRRCLVRNETQPRAAPPCRSTWKLNGSINVATTAQPRFNCALGPHDSPHFPSA
jgi:hypothetical protein